MLSAFEKQPRVLRSLHCNAKDDRGAENDFRIGVVVRADRLAIENASADVEVLVCRALAYGASSLQMRSPGMFAGPAADPPLARDAGSRRAACYSSMTGCAKLEACARWLHCSRSRWD